MKEKDQKINNKDIKKIEKKDEEKISGGSMEHCPICFCKISDDNMDYHLKHVHGIGNNSDKDKDK